MARPGDTPTSQNLPPQSGEVEQQEGLLEQPLPVFCYDFSTVTVPTDTKWVAPDRWTADVDIKPCFLTVDDHYFPFAGPCRPVRGRSFVALPVVIRSFVIGPLPPVFRPFAITITPSIEDSVTI